MKLVNLQHVSTYHIGSKVDGQLQENFIQNPCGFHQKSMENPSWRVPGGPQGGPLGSMGLSGPMGPCYTLALGARWPLGPTKPWSPFTLGTHWPLGPMSPWGQYGLHEPRPRAPCLLASATAAIPCDLRFFLIILVFMRLNKLTSSKRHEAHPWIKSFRFPRSRGSASLTNLEKYFLLAKN